MKLSEYIENLTQLLNEEGDIDCVYTSDEEGNSYSPLYSKSNVVLVNPDEYNTGFIDMVMEDGNLNEEESEIYTKKVALIN